MIRLKSNISYSTFSKEIKGASILWIEIPVCEIDIHNNCYWLKEAQGDTSNGIVKKSQLKLHLEKASQRLDFLLGMKRTLIESSKSSSEILHNLKIERSGNLDIKKMYPTNSTNIVSRIEFIIDKCELWNNKENLINIYGGGSEESGNILILKNSENQEIVIEVFESDDQENCMKLTIATSENQSIQLAKKHNWEQINNV